MHSPSSGRRRTILTTATQGNRLGLLLLNPPPPSPLPPRGTHAANLKRRLPCVSISLQIAVAQPPRSARNGPNGRGEVRHRELEHGRLQSGLATTVERCTWNRACPPGNVPGSQECSNVRRKVVFTVSCVLLCGRSAVSAQRDTSVRRASPARFRARMDHYASSRVYLLRHQSATSPLNRPKRRTLTWRRNDPRRPQTRRRGSCASPLKRTLATTRLLARAASGVRCAICCGYPLSVLSFGIRVPGFHPSCNLLPRLLSRPFRCNQVVSLS